MKPEIIFISEKDGLVRISKEDLTSLVDRAYHAGISDASKITTTPWIASPTWDKTGITCGADMRGDADEPI